MGIGQPVHFVLPAPETTDKALYIATLEIPEFENRHRMDQQPAETERTRKILVLIHIISCILRVTDLHSKNVGIVNGELKIVDFLIGVKESKFDLTFFHK